MLVSLNARIMLTGNVILASYSYDADCGFDGFK